MVFRVIWRSAAALASLLGSFPNILIFCILHILIGHYLQTIQPLTIEQTLRTLEIKKYTKDYLFDMTI